MITEWTIELITLLAARSSDHLSWHKCPTCKTEYSTLSHARFCEQGHGVKHEMAFLDYAPVPVKHKVIFADNQPLCGTCATKVKGDVSLTEVQMVDPGSCTRCNQLIQDPPAPPVRIPLLPASERRTIERLSMSRKALVDKEARIVWKKQEGIAHTVGVQSVDERAFKQCGPYRGPEGKAGLPRTRVGYIQASGEEVSCTTTPRF